VDIIKLSEQCLEAVIIPPNVKATINSEKLKNKIAWLDQEQMIQVIANLIKNSVEAMHNGGELNVILEDTGNEVIFTISDTGLGIKDEDKEKIFEPFFTTKGIGKGTGLGLATAYGIVKMHKGKIDLESNADALKGPTGTSFRIEIPRMR